MTWLQYAIVAAVACAVTIMLVPPVKRLAIRLDAVDYPSQRRVNKRPVARFGGVAMFGGLVAAFLTIYIGVRFLGWRYPPFFIAGHKLWYPGIAIGVFVAFLVGVADDIFNLKPLQKLVGQIVAASIIAASGLLLADIHNPFGPGQIYFGWLAYPITIFYLVAFANVINLIDGLDGLASGITVIATFTMFVFALITHRPDAAFLSIALIGVCLGFLRYNFNPASIFMGDSGSLLLGISLGVVSLFATTRSALIVSLLMPILVAGVPIIDTASAIIRRLRAHRPIQQADRGHIHHRLMQEGYSQRKTVAIMWGWTAILAVSAIFITELRGMARIPFIVLAGGVSLFFIVKLHLLGPVLQHHYNPRPSSGQKRANERFNAAAGATGKSEAHASNEDGADETSAASSLASNSEPGPDRRPDAAARASARRDEGDDGHGDGPARP